MAKILILIGAHLCTAPRPQKEAETLAGLGHEVIVRGFWFDPVLVERDQEFMKSRQWEFRPIVDFRPKHTLVNLSTRVRRRIAWSLYETLGVFTPELLGYRAHKALQVVEAEKPDLTIVHSEGGLWIGSQLLKRGHRVGVDFEDWFSEDLPVAARDGRPVKQLKQLEGELLRSCTYSLTTSAALASALSERYSAPAPKAVYNVFPWKERDSIDEEKLDRKELGTPSLHWFSHSIGPGRGLETLLAALPTLERPVEVHLRGNYPDNTKAWLEGLIPEGWHQRVHIHPLVPPDQLLSRIAEHDIGLALEQSDLPSRDLTVTNKLFQYMQAGLALIGTDTTGQREVMSEWAAPTQLVPCNDARALGEAINDLVSSDERLSTAKVASLAAAERQYSWEKQEDTVHALISQALA